MVFCWINEVGCSGDNIAAWVQAIGSIVAILAAIGIAYWQSEKERRARVENAQQRYENQKDTILNFMQCIFDELHRIKAGQRRSALRVKDPGITRIKDWLDVSKDFGIDTLATHETSAYLTIRGIANTVIHYEGGMAQLEISQAMISQAADAIDEFLDPNFSVQDLNEHQS